MSFFNRDNDPKKFQFDLKWKLMYQRHAKVEFKHSSDNDNPIQNVLEDNVEFEDATAFSSLITKGPNAGKHHPCLDIDVHHAYIQSSNPDHGHLILTGVTLDEDECLEFLQVMAKYGILEQGFVNVAKHRRQSWLRMPWIRKAGSELYKP